MEWLWIPVTMFAAAAQTVRNAVQRSVTKTAGVLPAAFIRFFYGLPFAVLFLAITSGLSSSPLPTPNAAFVAWVTLGAVTQVLAAALFVASMTHRSFVVSVVFSKTEVIQVAVLSMVFLGESISVAAVVATLLSTTGVVLLAGRTAAEQHLGIASWLSRGAFLGLASGAMLAICSVGYRGAMLEIPGHAAWAAAAYGLVWAQVIQTVLLGGWLFVRDREGLMKVIVNWRESLPGGLAGALASFSWLTAFAMRSAVDVRIVGLIEVFYSYAVSTRLFKEHVRFVEILGIVLVVVGIVVVSLAR
jgi:drug/metabolite transporter (DMT)-like permease